MTDSLLQQPDAYTEPLQREDAVSGTLIELVGLVAPLLALTLRMSLELKGRQELDLLLVGARENAEYFMFEADEQMYHSSCEISIGPLIYFYLFVVLVSISFRQ